jgi:hypothetical protein
LDEERLQNDLDAYWGVIAVYSWKACNIRSDVI